MPGNAAGAYSALMLLDQSGSITSTDPSDARLFAAKEFLSSLGSSDNVQVAAFADGGSLPFDPVTVYGNGFTNNGPGLFSTIDALASLESGGTPLYDAVDSTAFHTSMNAPNANKAVIVFTDGEDTVSAKTLDQAIARAKNLGIRLFTVGLSSGINDTVLLRMAVETGGGYVFAGDARRLISYYGTLGNVLSGSASFYQTKWTAFASGGSFNFSSGSAFTTSVRVNTPQGVLFAPFRIQVP